MLNLRALFTNWTTKEKKEKRKQIFVNTPIYGWPILISFITSQKHTCTHTVPSNWWEPACLQFYAAAQREKKKARTIDLETGVSEHNEKWANEEDGKWNSEIRSCIRMWHNSLNLLFIEMWTKGKCLLIIIMKNKIVQKQFHEFNLCVARSDRIRSGSKAKNSNVWSVCIGGL